MGTNESYQALVASRDHSDTMPPARRPCATIKVDIEQTLIRWRDRERGRIDDAFEFMPILCLYKFLPRHGVPPSSSPPSAQHDRGRQKSVSTRKSGAYFCCIIVSHTSRRTSRCFDDRGGMRTYAGAAALGAGARGVGARVAATHFDDCCCLVESLKLVGAG